MAVVRYMLEFSMTEHMTYGKKLNNIQMIKVQNENQK